MVYLWFKGAFTENTDYEGTANKLRVKADIQFIFELKRLCFKRAELSF